jgi:hypothetical protein
MVLPFGLPWTNGHKDARVVMVNGYDDLGNGGSK